VWDVDSGVSAPRELFKSCVSLPTFSHISFQRRNVLDILANYAALIGEMRQRTGLKSSDAELHPRPAFGISARPCHSFSSPFLLSAIPSQRHPSLRASRVRRKCAVS